MKASTKDSTDESSPLLSKEPEADSKQPSLIYTASNPDIPREVILQFFRHMIETLSLESTYDDLVTRSELENIPLDASNVLLQTDAMENLFHIEKQFGCKYLAQLPETNGSDEELVSMGKQFTYASVEGFVNAVKYRKRKQGLGLRTTGGMSRNTLLEFFELCNALMVLKSTRATLKAAYEETKKPPNQLVSLYVYMTIFLYVLF